MASGYDAAAEDYARWLETSVVDPARHAYLERFSALLSSGSAVLELGCGGGGSTTAQFAERYVLTGVDISARQVMMARERVPQATFLQADMTQRSLKDATFDGIAAFYSLIHLPYGELPGMLTRVASWLRPGGVLVASFGARGAGERIEGSWLAGVLMYWSGCSVEEYRRFIEDAGLVTVESSVEENIEDGRAAPFPWVIARRPAARE